MKHISKEEFFNQLNSCEYGRQYLELVTNPTNKLSEDAEGEDHHLYMKKICGENKELYRLSYYNHIKAHILLAKAGLEGHFSWTGKALRAVQAMLMRTCKKLYELEQIKPEEIEFFAELRALAQKENGKSVSKWWNNLSEEERKKIGNKISVTNNNPVVMKKKIESLHNTWDNKSLEEKKEHGKKVSNSLNNRSSEKKEEASKNISVGTKKGMANMSNEKKLQAKENRRKYLDNRTPEETKKIYEKQQKTMKEKPIEELLEIHHKIGKKSKEYHNSLTVEEKEEHNKNIVVGTKKGMANMSNEKRDEWQKNVKNGLNNRTDEQKIKSINKSKETAKKNKEGKIHVIKNTGPHANHNKWIFPEELPIYLADGWYESGNKPICIKVKNFTSEKNKNISNVQTGTILMTDGIVKPKWVIPAKQPEYFNKGWFRCRKNGNPLIEKSA